MTSINQNLVIWVDRTVIIEVPILDQNGQPYDMTGGSAMWSMALTAYTAPVLQKSTSSPPGGIVLSQINGLWTAAITIIPADTADIQPTNYYHELAAQDQAGDAVNLLLGTIALQPSLNRY